MSAASAAAWNKRNPAKVLARQRHYRRAIRGKVGQTYTCMRQRVTGHRRRGTHLYAGLPILPRDEFISWSLACPDYQRLHAAWAASGYELRMSPSIDRIDPRKGYELSNMQWITQSENASKAMIQRYYGISAA